MTFRIQIKPARNGWLPVAIQVADKSFEFVGSDVMNDPVEQLSSMLVSLLSGAPPSPAHFWGEEPTYSLLLTPSPDRSQVQLQLVYDPLTQLKGMVGELVAEAKVDFRAACRELHDSLSALSVSPAQEEHSVGWPHAFPVEQLRVAEGLLGQLRG